MKTIKHRYGTMNVEAYEENKVWMTVWTDHSHVSTVIDPNDVQELIFELSKIIEDKK